MVVGAVVAAGAVLWTVVGADDSWVVRGRTSDFANADRACGDLPGVRERSFSSTSDMPTGSLSEGVHWIVEGRDKADVVASCLEANGVPTVTVERAREREPQEFENTGP